MSKWLAFIAILSAPVASVAVLKAQASCRFAYACLSSEQEVTGEEYGKCATCGANVVGRTRTLTDSYDCCENGHVHPSSMTITKDPYTKAIEEVLATKKSVTVFFYDSSDPNCPVPRGQYACDLAGKSENFRNYWIDKGDTLPAQKVIAYSNGKAVRG